MYAQPVQEYSPPQHQQQMPPLQPEEYVPKVRTISATWKNNAGCPECGSKNYGSRHLATPMAGTMGAGGSVTNLKTGQVATVAETCFDCGYPKVQFGSAMGDGGAIQTVRDTPVSGQARTSGTFTTGAHLGVWDPDQGRAGMITE